METTRIGDITLADAFYEMINLLKKAMDSRILSGKNIEKIDLEAHMQITSWSNESDNSKLDYEFHIE